MPDPPGSMDQQKRKDSPGLVPWTPNFRREVEEEPTNQSEKEQAPRWEEKGRDTLGAEKKVHQVQVVTQQRQVENKHQTWQPGEHQCPTDIVPMKEQEPKESQGKKTGYRKKNDLFKKSRCEQQEKPGAGAGGQEGFVWMLVRMFQAWGVCWSQPPSSPSLAEPGHCFTHGNVEEWTLHQFLDQALRRPANSTVPGRHQDIWLPHGETMG